MPLTAKQQEFRLEFAKELRANANNRQKTLATNEEYLITDKFIEALLTYKEGLENNSSRLSPRIKGEITWCLKKHAITVEFANRLGSIFEPIDDFSSELAAFWSGPSIKMAETNKKDFGNTLTGYALNKTQELLKEAFTSLAYTPDELLDTTTNLGMWNAFSILYARGSQNITRIFLHRGMTSYQSILWTSEIPIILERLRTQAINQIILCTLTKPALEQYERLEEAKKRIAPESVASSDVMKRKIIDEQINELLKNGVNWEEKPFTKTNHFANCSLITSGIEEEKSTGKVTKVSIATIFRCKEKFMKPLNEKKKEVAQEEKPVTFKVS